MIEIDPDEYLAFYGNTTVVTPPLVDVRSNVMIDSMWLRWLRSVEEHYYLPHSGSSDSPSIGYYNYFILPSYDYFTLTHPQQPLLVDQYQSRRLVNNPSRVKQIVRPAGKWSNTAHCNFVN